MRLVDLHLDADRPVDLTLHARLTVVVTEQVVRDRIASLLARAYVLAGIEIAGTVDGGGYLTPLDPTAVVALNLPGDGLRVLTPQDLPAPDPARRDVARVAAVAERDRFQADADRDRAAVEHLRRVYEATSAAVEAGREELAAAEARRADLDVAGATLEHRPPELDAEQAAAEAAAAAAATRIDELTAGRERLAAELGPGGDGSHLRMGHDVAPLVEICERAAAVGALGAEEAQALVSWLDELARSTAPVHPDAQRLIDESAEVEQAWEASAAAGVEGDPEVVAALARRDRLAEIQTLLQGLSRSGLLGDTAKSEIESAHAAVVAGGHHQRDRDAAIEVEDETLSRYGFDSYLDFTIATSTRSVGQKAEAKLRLVTQELAGAEEDLTLARNGAARRLEELAARREPQRERVAAFLGAWPEGPAEPLLSAVPDVPPELGMLTFRFDQALDTARDEVRRYHDEVEELIEERAALGSRREELAAQRAHIDGRIAEIQGLLARAEPELAAAAGRHELAVAAARGSEASLAAAWRAAEELEDADGQTYTVDDHGAVIDTLLSALDPWSPNPAPVVLHDTLAPLGVEGAVHVLQALLAGAPATQLVYLTEDPGLRDWAQRLAPEAGACLVLQRPNWLQRRLGRRSAGRFPG